MIGPGTFIRGSSTDRLSTRWFGVLALLVLGGVTLVLYLPYGLLQPPSGLHYIRQTDSLSFISYFRLHSGTLFEPGTLDLVLAPDNGKAAAEFPIVYWIIAQLSNLFGSDTGASLRAVSLSFILVGHFSVMMAMFKILGRVWIALGAGVWMFGSSVVVYYACNYLPDAAVYGSVLLGWSLVLPSIFKGDLRIGWPTLAAFTFAGLVKAPAAMHLFAVGAVLVAFGSARTERPHSFRGAMSSLTGVFVGLLLIIAWHAYAITYNRLHGSHYFLTWAEPIWRMDATERARTLDLIWRYWWAKYLHPSTWHALILLTVFVLVRARRMTRQVLVLLAALFLGSCAFVLLFFQKLADHDYYFLTIVPFVVILIIAGLHALVSIPKLTRWMWLVSLVVWALGLASVDLARTELARRNVSVMDRFARTGELLRDLPDAVAQVELPVEARIIVLGDSTPNGGLLVLGRLGWSFPGYPEPAVPDYPALLEAGATHVLTIHPATPPDLDLEPIEVNADHGFYRIIR